MENGRNLKLSFLNSSNTSEIYTQVSTKSLQQIKVLLVICKKNLLHLIFKINKKHPRLSTFKRGLFWFLSRNF